MTAEPCIVASAPGKVVLLGEYAVLEGAPALVMAVPARAMVRVRAAGEGPCTLDVPDLGVHQQRFSLDEAGLRWSPRLAAGKAARLRVLGAVLNDIRRRVQDALPSCAIETDTRAFVSLAGVKLGLGSSAAVAVATWAALRSLASGRLPAPGAVFEAVLEVHRLAQGGVGSGVDVAASCLGGVLEYSLGPRGRDDHPSCRQIALPEGLRIVAIHTGTAASTPEFVAQVRGFARRDPIAYRDLLSGLSELARAGCAAAEHGDREGMLVVSRAYGLVMEELGRLSGADILSAAQRRVQVLVEREGAMYKPSGAGGGDLGLAFTDDEAVVKRIHAAAAREDLLAMDLVPDPRGVEVLLPGLAGKETKGDDS